ncbi:MAG: 2-phospho-L-lactate guanylyltransferase [Methanomicrobia archaeon]|nr:2-phospho-L-lactate guanylyltransferase [Methanomicrobia archaeon]
MKAVIPFKQAGAKSRLGAVLSENEREELALCMLQDVLVALARSTIHEVEIITTAASADLMAVTKQHGASNMRITVREDRRDLNDALNDLLADEREPVLVLMADIPLAQPGTINEIVAHPEEVVIAPGRKGGTNALFLRNPSAFSVSYYGTSFLKHRELAQRRHLSVAIHDSFLISTDIDEVDDLIELLIHGKGYSTAYLRHIGVQLLVDTQAKTRTLITRSAAEER